MTILVSRYYEIITPESAEVGDAEERGEVYTDNEMSIRDAIGQIKSGGFNEPSDSHINVGTWLSTSDPDRDYHDGSERYESIHFRKVDGSKLSVHQLRRIFRAAKITIR